MKYLKMSEKLNNELIRLQALRNSIIDTGYKLPHIYFQNKVLLKWLAGDIDRIKAAIKKNNAEEIEEVYNCVKNIV